ncbi:MAG: protein-L-isoaspartate O-methyltransferase [Alphaproteobacteria bacterium]|nr:MAG: protein-L-isoaspartate O-methyltransferase [Alphaproteobacteria bacterium]
MENFALARDHMIDGQLKPNHVTDPRVLAALRAVPRELFVPKALRGVAYVDEDIEVAPGRFLMEPMVFARLLQETRIKDSDLVLDIGCATGYSSAVLSELAAALVAVEEVPELVERAKSLLAERECGNVAVVEGPLNRGAPDHEPFDVIFINGAVEQIPDALFDQLAEGGRLACVHVVNGVGKASLFIKDGGVIGRRPLFDAAVPVLPGFERPRGFVF